MEPIDDEPESGRTPPPPEHRVWRHPSELTGTALRTGRADPALPSRRRETLMAAGAGLVGAVAAGALLVLLLPGGSNPATLVAPAVSAIPQGGVMVVTTTIGRDAVGDLATTTTTAESTTTTTTTPPAITTTTTTTPPAITTATITTSTSSTTTGPATVQPSTITLAQLVHNGATAVPLHATDLWLTTAQGLGDLLGAVEVTWGTSGAVLATVVARGDGFTVLQLDRQLGDVPGIELADEAPQPGSWVTVMTSGRLRGVVVARDGGLALAGVASHDAELEGAPVLDQQGRLVGLCSNDRGTTTLIPVTDAARVIDSRRLPPWMGIAATTSIEEGEPFTLITEVTRTGPAEQAGLRVGDVITSIDAEPIDTVVRLAQVLERFRPGDAVVITVRRGTALVDVNVTLVPRPFSL